jgi:hypothetical protein
LLVLARKYTIRIAQPSMDEPDGGRRRVERDVGGKRAADQRRDSRRRPRSVTTFPPPAAKSASQRRVASGISLTCGTTTARYRRAVASVSVRSSIRSNAWPASRIAGMSRGPISRGCRSQG